MWPFGRKHHEHDIYTYLYHMEARLMANQADLNAALDALQVAVTDEIKQLADAIAAQTPPVDLAAEVARVQSAIDALKADDPVVTPPPVEPPPAETPPE